MGKASRRVVAVSRKPGTIQAEFTDQTMKPFQLCPPTPLHSSVLITTTPDLVSMRPDATEWSKAKVCVCVCSAYRFMTLDSRPSGNNFLSQSWVPTSMSDNSHPARAAWYWEKTGIVISYFCDIYSNEKKCRNMTTYMYDSVAFVKTCFLNRLVRCSFLFTFDLHS